MLRGAKLSNQTAGRKQGKNSPILGIGGPASIRDSFMVDDWLSDLGKDMLILGVRVFLSGGGSRKKRGKERKRGRGREK